MRGMVERVAGGFAFFPPAPPWYELRDGPAGEKVIHSKWTARMVGPGRADYEALQLVTKRGERLAAMYIPCPKKVSLTLLFSHGNAVDIGQLAEFFRELAIEMQLNVLGYDYSGYGCSTGVPSVSNTKLDIDACYAWLQSKGCSPSDVILYGQSVGSGPVIDLASRTKGLAGVILHSPLLSGMQVLKPAWSWWPSCLDVYNNSSLVSKIDAPVLVMHGTKDEVVGFHHGQAIHRRLKNPHPPLWAKGMGHQNLELDPQFMPTLQGFVAACQQKA